LVLVEIKKIRGNAIEDKENNMAYGYGKPQKKKVTKKAKPMKMKKKSKKY